MGNVILIVDNNEELMAFFKIILKNYKVDYAYNLKQARKYLEKNKYELILLDKTLDWENGLDLLPLENVVIMSTESFKGYDFLKKPFKKKQLLDKINEYTQK